MTICFLFHSLVFSIDVGGGLFACIGRGPEVEKLSALIDSFYVSIKDGFETSVKFHSLLSNQVSVIQVS